MKTVCRYNCSTTNDTLALCFHGPLLTLQRAPSKIRRRDMRRGGAALHVIGGRGEGLSGKPATGFTPPTPPPQLLCPRQTVSLRWSGSSSRSSGGNRRENKLSSLRFGTNKLSSSSRRRRRRSASGQSDVAREMLPCGVERAVSTSPPEVGEL